HLRAPGRLQVGGGLAVGGGVDGAGGDGDHTDAQRGQVAGGDQRHAHHAALGRGVGQLADLALEGGDRGGGDDDAAAALVERVGFGDGGRRQAQDVEDRGQVVLDGGAETFQRQRLSVLADQPAALGGTAVGVDRDTQRAERFRLRDGGVHRFLVGGIGVHVADAEFLLQFAALL